MSFYLRRNCMTCRYGFKKLEDYPCNQCDCDESEWKKKSIILEKIAKVFGKISNN